MVDLPKPIVKWFKSNLENFDLLDTGLENGQLFVEDTCPLLGSNSGHLPLDLRVIVNRFVMGSLKKEAPEKANKKREGVGSSPPLLLKKQRRKEQKKQQQKILQEVTQIQKQKYRVHHFRPSNQVPAQTVNYNTSKSQSFVDWTKQLHSQHS